MHYRSQLLASFMLTACPGLGPNVSPEPQAAPAATIEAPGPAPAARQWTLAGELPMGLESFEVAVVGSRAEARLYVLGGWTGRGVSEKVYSAPLDGGGWKWREEPALPLGLELFGLVTTPEAMCTLGGFDGSGIRDEVLCWAGSETDGWKKRGTLPRPRSSAATVTIGEYVYLVGGGESADAPATSSVFSSAREDLVDWASTTAMERSRARVTAVAMDGDLVVLAGHDESGEIVGSVVRARPDGKGGLGPWETAATLPSPRLNVSAVVDHEMLMVTGGRKVEPEGFAQTWLFSGERGASFSEGPALPSARWGHRMVHHDERTLLLGGWESPARPPTASILGLPDAQDH